MGGLRRYDARDYFVPSQAEMIERNSRAVIKVDILFQYIQQLCRLPLLTVSVRDRMAINVSTVQMLQEIPYSCIQTVKVPLTVAILLEANASLFVYS